LNKPKDKKSIAVHFGEFLDQDKFEELESILEDNCEYLIADQVVYGNEKICSMYRKAMMDGREKFDVLNWGKSRVTEITNQDFDILFTDNFVHNGIAHQYCCKQRVSVNKSFRIFRIQHFEIKEERVKLDKYLKQVGLK